MTDFEQRIIFCSSDSDSWDSSTLERSKGIKCRELKLSRVSRMRLLLVFGLYIQNNVVGQASTLCSTQAKPQLISYQAPQLLHKHVHSEHLYVCMYVCMSTCYGAPSRFLLPTTAPTTESEFHAEAHEQLRVKELPRVPTRRLGVDSNPQPSGCKAQNIPLYHRAPTR